MTYTLESTVGEILKDEVAVKIFEKYVPGITRNPMIGFAKGMSLNSLISFPQLKQNGITEEMLIGVLAEIDETKQARGKL